MSTTFKRSLANKVTERVRSGKCLLCDKQAVRRGLCMNHYMIFRRRRNLKSETDGAVFEESCIREGKILAVNEMRKLKSDDPFGDL